MVQGQKQEMGVMVEKPAGVIDVDWCSLDEVD